MSKNNFERSWFILSRLAAISIVAIIILEGFARYLSDVAVIPGLLLGIILFLVFFSR